MLINDNFKKSSFLFLSLLLNTHISEKERIKTENESLITRSKLVKVEETFIKNQLQLIYDSFTTMTSIKMITDFSICHL